MVSNISLVFCTSGTFYHVRRKFQTCIIPGISFGPTLFISRDLYETDFSKSFV